MKRYTITVVMYIDNHHQNAPSLADLQLGVENAVTTPDNEMYGIKSVQIEAKEEVV